VAKASESQSGIVTQVKRAFLKKNRLATFIGIILGGFVPVAIYVVSHNEAGAAFSLHPTSANGLVLGGLLYSAQTVYQWARAAFTQAIKSVGFCVLLEGVMVTSQTKALTLAALFLLVAINGIATGCKLSLGSVQS